MKKILFFTARYCGKCFAIKKRFNKLMVEDKIHIDYEFINIEKDKEAVKKYQIEGIPITIVLEDNKVVKRITGSLYEEDLLELVK